MAVYRKGSTGAGVVDLQTQLNKLGASLSVDGQYGPATVQAVTQFQKDNDLTADGVAGPVTLNQIDSVISLRMGEKLQDALADIAKLPSVKELEKFL